MRRMWKSAIATIVSIVATVAPRPTQAGIHRVWDPAHLFKAETIQDVEQILDEISTKHLKDLMIETFPSIPDDFKRHYQEQDKAKFYEDWSVVEGRALGVNGVLILITGEPKHLHVYVGLDTRNKAFTLADRDELVQQLTKAFRDRQFDSGLIAAATFVRDRMARNLATPPTTQPATRPSTSPAESAAPESGSTRLSK